MMLNVKIYMYQQQMSVDFENQLNKEGQQEGMAPATYRTQKFILEKRRQIKQKLGDIQSDAQSYEVQNNNTCDDKEHTVESVRKRHTDKA